MSFCFSLFLVKKAKYPKGLLINVNGCHLSLWLLFRLPLLSEYSHGFYKLFPLYIQAIEGFLNFVQKVAMLLGYICKKICQLELSSIAQYGHTGWRVAPGSLFPSLAQRFLSPYNRSRETIVIVFR